MHSTAFTSFPKPFALILPCDTAIFRPERAAAKVRAMKLVKLCSVTPLLKSDSDQVMKKTTTFFPWFVLFGLSQAYILANSNRDFTHL